MRSWAVGAAVIVTGLCVSPVGAQTIDWARVTIGISGGVFAGFDLWRVPAQPIRSSNTPPGQPPDQVYPPDVYSLHRHVPRGFALAVHATRFANYHLGLTAELAYIGATSNSSCQLAVDGGDPELATACAYVGSSAKFAAGTTPGVGYHDATGTDQSGATTMVQGGVVIRPFHPARVQTFVTLLGGISQTTHSTIALQSIYGAHADTALTLTIYNDYGWKQIKPSMTVGIGIMTAPSSGLVLRVEAREAFVLESVVTGATTVQGDQPPYHAALRGIPTVLVGVELALQRQHGKRY